MADSSDCHLLIIFLLSLDSLFLKCKHGTGSGSGGAAGHNCNSKDGEKTTQHFDVNLKAVLADLQERKEDFDKLKQKLDRLEVSCRFFIVLSTVPVIKIAN